MGEFSITTVLRNRDGLSREQFTELFCKVMREKGYVATDKENSEFFRAVAFTDKWITLVSDCPDIAKSLNMDCVRVEEVDGDFITFDVYSGGKKVESILIGEPYWDEDENEAIGYFDPTEKVWGGFLEDGYSWEKFMEAFNEDSAKDVAEIIGMNNNHIYLSEKYIEEEWESYEDDSIYFLYFRKA